MITRIAQAALLVREYEEGIAFYRDKLGFELVEDTPLPGGKRWVRLKPRGGECEILLSRAVDDRQRAAVGNQTGGRVLFFLYTDDFDADYRSLREKGIEFTEGPRRTDYGQVAVFLDLYGNRLDLIERK